jgi:hypothetical protein
MAIHRNSHLFFLRVESLPSFHLKLFKFPPQSLQISPNFPFMTSPQISTNPKTTQSSTPLRRFPPDKSNTFKGLTAQEVENPSTRCCCWPSPASNELKVLEKSPTYTSSPRDFFHFHFASSVKIFVMQRANDRTGSNSNEAIL